MKALRLLAGVTEAPVIVRFAPIVMRFSRRLVQLPFPL
jgi:hypothetical protein